MSFSLDDLILMYTLYFLIRSSGYRSICVLLLLPSACSDCRGNDAWTEIGFHYYPSHEVMKTTMLSFWSRLVCQSLNFGDYLLNQLVWQVGCHTYELLPF